MNTRLLWYSYWAGAIEFGIRAASDSASAAQSMPLDADDASSMPEEQARGRGWLLFFLGCSGPAGLLSAACVNGLLLSRLFAEHQLTHASELHKAEAKRLTQLVWHGNQRRRATTLYYNYDHLNVHIFVDASGDKIIQLLSEPKI